MHPTKGIEDAVALAIEFGGAVNPQPAARVPPNLEHAPRRHTRQHRLKGHNAPRQVGVAVVSYGAVRVEVWRPKVRANH